MKRLFGMVTTSRSHGYTRHALETFFQYTPLTPDDEFILIDNNNDSPKDISSYFPHVQPKFNVSPKGFAENMNPLFDRAKETHADLFLLNNDIIFTPDWISPLQVERAAITSPVCNMQFQYATPQFQLKLTMSLSDYLGNEETFLQVAKHHLKTKRGYQLAHSFPFYCTRIPYSVHSVIGKFDESYSIAGWEDVDYILRCYLEGFPLFFAVDSFILHFYGKSTWAGDSSPDQREQEYLNSKAPQYKFEEKWGKEVSDLFGLQLDTSMEKLRKRQEEASIELYKKIILER